MKSIRNKNLRQNFSYGSLNHASATLFFFWLFNWLINLVMYYQRGFFNQEPYPWNTPLPAPITRFGDFFAPFSDYVTRAGIGGTISYFPAVYFVYEIFTFYSNTPWTAVLPYLYIPIIALCLIFSLQFRDRSLFERIIILFIGLFSYPTLFALHTGNLEIYIAVILAAAAICAKNGRWTSFTILISLAGSVKLLPLGFLILNVFKCRTRLLFHISLSISIFAFLQISSLIILPNGVLAKGTSELVPLFQSVLEGKRIYAEMMINSVSGVHYSHSFSNAIFSIAGEEVLSTFQKNLITLVWCVVGLIILHLLSRNLAPLWTFFAVIGSVGCLAPATSTDYKLVYLYPALALLLHDFGEKGDSEYLSRNLKVNLICGMLIIFTISPKGYAYLHGYGFFSGMVYLTPMTLMALLLVVYLTFCKQTNVEARLKKNNFRRR